MSSLASIREKHPPQAPANPNEAHTGAAVRRARAPLPSRSMPHDLVIGGTGMLRAVCLHLAGRGHDVSVLARRHARLSALAHDAASLPGRIHPLPADYRDPQQLALALRAAATARGPFATAILWVRADAPEALDLVADFLASRTPPARVYHILGSAAADPTRLPDTDHLLARGLRPRRVILGFVRGPAGSRWLTNDEIAGGVVRALDDDRDETVVGEVRPWEARPR